MEAKERSPGVPDEIKKKERRISKRERVCRWQQTASAIGRYKLPTVSTKALFISCVIDAHVGRDIATVDIPGAFLQAHLKENEEIFMVLLGKMAELLCAIEPEK